MKSLNIFATLLFLGASVLKVQAQENVPKPENVPNAVAKEFAVRTVTVDNTNKVPFNDEFKAAPEFNFTMYPNPVVKELTVVPRMLEIGSIEITDQQGKLKFAMKPEVNPDLQKELKLDLSMLPKGNYFIRVIARAGAMSTQRLVKQ